MRAGIAGYMGAGKSTCARALSSANTVIIDADAEAKRLMLSDPKFLLDFKEAFGEDVGDVGAVNFGALGRKAFSTVDTLLTLNKIIHPPLVRHLQTLLMSCEKQNCILDAALIPLWGAERWFDLRVWVDTPFEVRLKRLAAKSADLGEEELRRRMRLQEETMSVPQNGVWVKLPDSECARYIKSRLADKTRAEEQG